VQLTATAAFVTGARRVGAAAALALARGGADVALGYHRHRDEVDLCAHDIASLGRRAIVVQIDVTSQSSVDAAFAEIDREFGRLDVLVNMASIYERVPFDALTMATVERHLAVDLGGTFRCALAAAPRLRARGGRIINVTDWVAASGRPRYKGYASYYVAKAGVKALTEALALELAADQILVNAIAAGPILAPVATTDEESAAVVRATPLGRWGGADEVAKAVIALVESDFITGETIRVDGGRHLS
jgi:NAD(P)-dependent dehydrogenase (short-subunit alcohol dehydrogenase family)